MASESLIFRAVFDEFNKIYVKTVHVVDKAQLIFGILGVFGSGLGLITMIHSRKMSNTSFTYHKVLTGASLVSCVNYLLFKVSTDVLAVRPFVYKQKLLAIYSGILSRATSSTCGYMGLYMGLFVALDRCMALLFGRRYFKYSQKRLCVCEILSALILSAFVHSWATWVENEIVEIPNTETNETLFTYKRAKVSKNLIKIKNLYNAVIRLPYPFVLGVLTGISIWQFLRKQRVGKWSADSDYRTFTAKTRRIIERGDRSLFILMICVVILAFVHVTPREIKRIIELLYPKDRMMKNTLDDSLPLDYRLQCFRMMLYGEKLLTVICNLCGMVDRGLLFYLYLALNSTFRQAVKQLLNRIFCCKKPAPEYFSLFSASATPIVGRSTRSVVRYNAFRNSVKRPNRFNHQYRSPQRRLLHSQSL